MFQKWFKDRPNSGVHIRQADFLSWARSSDRYSRRKLCLESLEGRDLMAVLSGVVPDGPRSDEPRSIRIINGNPTSDFPSVGMVGDSSGFFCSGTLIAPQFVLTAAHCAEGVGYTAGRFRLGTATYSTSQVFVHPNYNANIIGDDNANDIAIYKLSSAVTNVAPTPIYRSTPTVGQMLTLVGFGGGGTGNTGTDGSFGTKRVGTTPIDAVSPKMIRWRFDNNNEANTAPGDSGGPAFVTIGGARYLAGVTSGGELESAGIGDQSFDTRVDAFASWIDSIVGSVSSQATVSIRASDATAAENSTGQTANAGTLTISRTGPLTNALSVNLAYSGTATRGTDYTSVPTSLTIPAGATTATIVIAPIDDSLVEGSETVVVSIVVSSSYSIDGSASAATITIADNDVATPATNNDMFANRIRLTGSTATAIGNNSAATQERGEPNVAGVSGGKSVWWTWTAPASGQVQVTTAASSFDTTLGVYRGSSISALTRIATNDDDPTLPNALTSRVVFNAIAGVAYQIAVDGYQGASGNLKLELNQTPGRAAGNAKSAELAYAAFINDLADNVRWRRNLQMSAAEIDNPYFRHSQLVDRIWGSTRTELFE